MSNEKPSKINQLLLSQPSGVIFLSSWLVDQGYSLDLQKRYKKSNWLKSIGTGAMIRVGDDVGYEGAIYALQNQVKYQLHPGGKTALSLQGKSHYLDLGLSKVFIFGEPKATLPGWFKTHNWGPEIIYRTSSFLPAHLGLSKLEVRNFSIKISSPARAMLECLYLVPSEQSLTECFELMEGLNNLRPNLVQELLEQCTSIKVKRLFLYLAEKVNHGWLKYLKLEEIDLGKGKRSIIKNGVYIPRYQITVSKELEHNDKQEL